jgi:hypothetical protein
MSSSQLFKQKIPIDLFYNYIKILSHEEDKFYLISDISFKQAKYHNILQKFCDDILPYYYISKQFYVKRDLNYNKFITIIRQICNSLNIKYASKIKYNKSLYDISYYIYKLDET